MDASMLRGLLRDPLTHFLGAGLLVFGLHHWLQANGQRSVVVSAERLGALEAGHEARTGAPPTEAERVALLDDHVRREILLREGLALGLDRGDPVVRRRVIQKMEYLLQSVAPPEPSRGQLQAHLDSNLETYARPATHDLEHVFVAHKEGRDGAALAEELLSKVQSGEEPATLGDAFVHGPRFTGVSPDVTARRFGAGFEGAVTGAPLGRWLIARSDHGWHVARVLARTGASTPRLDEVLQQVRDGWHREWQQREARRQEAELLARYQVERTDAP